MTDPSVSETYALFDLTREHERLTAEVERLRVDAGRYAWLRVRLDSVDWFYGDPPRAVLAFGIPSNMRVSANLDATIDAAMSGG